MLKRWLTKRLAGPPPAGLRLPHKVLTLELIPRTQLLAVIQGAPATPLAVASARFAEALAAAPVLHLEATAVVEDDGELWLVSFTRLSPQPLRLWRFGQLDQCRARAASLAR